MGDLEIHIATAADIDEVHDLEARSFPAPWRRDFFEGELRASGRFNLVVRRDGALVAYLFSMWFFDEMHVNKIAVAEHERRKGIAADLMDKCIRFARANRIKSISLEVRKGNSSAQEFYTSLDFAPSYTRPRYYPDGEAAVVMMRNIG